MCYISPSPSLLLSAFLHRRRVIIHVLPSVLRALSTMLWLSVLSIFAAARVGFADPIAPCWDDMRVKHSWGSIPEKWEYHRHPPAGATIDLRVALKSHHENALIDSLYEVSDPKHPKCVSVPLYRTGLRLLTNPSVANTDTARTYPRRKSPTSSRRIRTRSN